MAFWGIEIKPGKPYIHRYDDELGRLHVSQATLGSGSSTKKNILQCNVGNKKPIYLTSLLPEKIETCPLSLDFEEEDEVTFSVIGPCSIHLSGFFYGESDRQDYEGESSGEDIGETDSEDEDSVEFDSEDEYDDGFIVDDHDMYPSSPVPNSGVKIEEILDDENPTNGNDVSKKPRRKNIQSNMSDENNDSQRQIVVKNQNNRAVLEDEDEDGFPISSPSRSNGDAVNVDVNLKGNDEKERKKREKVKGTKSTDKASIQSLKRKINTLVQENVKTSDDSETLSKQNNKSKKKKVRSKEVEAQEPNCLDATTAEDIMATQVENGSSKKSVNVESLDVEEKPPTGKEKKDKKKKKRQQQQLDAPGNGDMELDEANTKSSHVRTYPNGLIVEELKMGIPDGKRASPGKKVSVRYIGKLKKNGKIFDSNVGRAPFKFRLGVGQVIKGWDVGVTGMRVGDKRRLTIPPAMGYGKEGAGAAIPPNAWLIFDVELVDVN